MNSELAELLQARSQLRANIALQREQLARTAQHWRKPCSVADQGVKGIRWIKAHPAASVGVVAIFWLRRRGISGLISGVWRGWNWYRQIRSVLDKIPASKRTR
jgi:hypothetical protein